jgi:zinc/manganese transport system substrate-binding protein
VWAHLIFILAGVIDMFFRPRTLTWLFISLLACSILLNACGSVNSATGNTSASSSSQIVNVVAAENFYGNIVQQLGGSHVNVTSILSDPSVDPHDYTSNVQTATKVATANLVIENGLGYDSWMDKLLSASNNANRVVLAAGTLATHPLPDNPHVWYGLDNMPAIAQGITNALKKFDPSDAATFERNLATFKQSLLPLQQKITSIRARYNNTPVALTETIYLYQTQPAGLNVLTPFEFMKANAEGTDPPANTITAINNSINSRQVKVLIYNEQTVTPITTNVQNEAKKQNIPIVPVTETMPPTKTYQTWIGDQLAELSDALQQSTGK